MTVVNYFNKIVWSVEKESDLIDLVYEKPALWDSTDKNYSKKTYKKILYKHIAEEMGRRWPKDADVFTGRFLMAKFGAIRSYFQKEEKKINSNPQFYPKWIHYHRLMFLRDPTLSPPEKPIEITYVKREAQDPFTISERQQGGEETSSNLPVIADTCTVARVDFETEQSRKELKDRRVNLPVEDDTCTDEEESTEDEPPRKRKYEKEDEQKRRVETFSFQNSQTQPSMSASIAQMVHSTLTNLSPEDGSQCAQEIFSIILKYIKSPEKLNCTK